MKKIYLLLLLSCLHFVGFGQVANSESFDGTVFPPLGWTNTNTAYCYRIGTAGTNPTAAIHSGAGMVAWDNWGNCTSAVLCTPVISYANRGSNTPTVTVWFWRDGAAYNSTSYNNERVTIYVNTSASVSGATQIGMVPRRRGQAATGFASSSGAAAPSANGWYSYTFNIPAGYNTATNYIVFSGISQCGEFQYMDDVSWISYPAACAGTPAPGNTIATPASVCSGNTTVLTLQNATPGSGVTYQWKSAPDVSGAPGAYTNITGATTSTYTATITSIKWFKCDVTCASTTTTSNQVQVVLGGFAQCTAYCNPTSSCASNDMITNVTFAGINNTTVCNNNQLYASPIAAVTAGTSPNITTTVTNGGSTEYVAAWIDFNQNGTFDASEYLSVGAAAGGTFTTPFPIPLTALPGITRMRVRVEYNTALGPGDACLSYTFGETEDYLVNVSTPPIIQAAPTALSFGYVTTGTSSLAQTTNVSGLYLVPAAGTYTVTAPANFQVSSNGSTWVSSYTTAYTASTFAAVPVYVRMNPVAAIAYSGNVTVIGGGATVNVACSGNGAIACSGTPVGGTSSISPVIGDAATPFTLTASGYSTTGGISFQWQSSPNGTAWTDISGATLSTYSFTGITATKYFRCNITCSNSSITVSGAQCVANYLIAASCTPTYYSSALSDRLDNFLLNGYAGSTINDNGPTVHPSVGYEDRTLAVAPVNLVQGASYTGTVTYTPSYYYYENQIFIDFNDNGTFETTENVTNVFGTGGCTTSVGSDNYTLNIPALAATGYHRMRVRTANTLSCTNSTAINPCGYADVSFYNYYYYGTTRDYVANIVAACTPPAVITGTPSMCVGASTSLADATAGGTWASSSPAIATINSSGVVSGLAQGTTTISYTVAGCPRMVVATVNALPSAITIAPTTASTVCLGGSATYTATATSPSTAPYITVLSQDWNSGLSPWTITNTAGNATSYWSIRTPPGYTSAIPGDGTPYMQAAPDAITTVTNTRFTSPSFSLAGYTTAKLEYNQNFSVYSGDATVAVEYSINGGTTWTTLVNQLGTAAGISTFDPAVPQISVTFPPAAIGQSNVMVRWNYISTYGFYWTIDNIKISAVPPPTYTWAGIAGASGLSCTNCASPTITPVATGANVYSVTATSNGCSTTSGVTITTPVPAAITGNLQVCAGLTTTLSSTGVGTWSSGASAIATVVPGTGIVTGVTAGTARITYTITATGCISTAIVTVNPLPTAITSSPNVCLAGTTTLTGVPSGGTWTAAVPAIASINSVSGVVSGVSIGSALVTYILPTSCILTTNVSVNPLPALTVSPATSASLCLGESTSFTADAPVAPFPLLSQDFNSGLAGWTISNTAGGTSSYWQISPSPAYGGIPGDGSNMMQAASEAAGGGNVTTILTSPSFSTAGFGSATLTFNQFLISTVPDVAVAVEYSTNGGTTWSTLLNQLNAFEGTGSWTASAPEATVAFPPAALGQPNVKLRWKYDAASYYWYIDNIKVQALLPLATYAWVGSAGLSCTNCATPTVTPVTVGSNLYSVTATSSAGCTSTSPVTVTINPVPGTITGNTPVCEGAIRNLGNPVNGGVWSSGDVSKATVNASTGAVTGILAGTAAITYTLPEGCKTSVIVTVNQTPGDITGTADVCAGLTTALASPQTGGAWTSSASSTASVNNTSGVVTGNIAGNANITYTLPAGCFKVRNVTVNPLPANIAGPAVVCENATIQLTDADAGGSWLSLASANAGIDASGLVTGVAMGTSVIRYTLPTGCKIETEITVNPIPAAITGTAEVCAGLTTTLSESVSGGTWSSSAAATASVNSTGIVTGHVAGAANISYTLTTTGCFITKNITVNPLPAPIAGNPVVCEMATTQLSDIDAGGTWQSSASTTASVDATGLTTGVAAGNAVVTYTLPTGCINTVSVTVLGAPGVISGTPQVCFGLTTVLAESVPDGIWSSGAPATASVDAWGLVSGNAVGSTYISYTLPTTGCFSIKHVTVNPIPAAINGPAAVCQAATVQLNDADAGGTWQSADPTVAAINSAGVVTGMATGNTTITYTLPTTCIITKPITTNLKPSAIGGTLNVCEGLSTALTNDVNAGIWTSASTTTATVDVAGIVTGGNAGNVNISYTLANGCYTTAPVTVNALPQAITGNMEICVNGTTTLGNADAGGNWSSNNIAVATIDNTGLVSGIHDGVTTISYTLATGCVRTATVVVDPLPAPIAGADQVCENATINLSNATASGNWQSETPLIASVDADGMVTGMTQGTTNITYALPTGCLAVKTVTVNHTPVPSTGIMEICKGATSELSNAEGAGNWSSNIPSVASVNASGSVSGMSAGNAMITFSLPTGCYTTSAFTVNPLPAAISGSTVVCEQSQIQLANTTANGAWSVSGTGNISISNTGMVTGILAGDEMVTYTLPTGCMSATSVHVNAIPGAINGTLNVCKGLTTTLSNNTANGVWASSTPAVAYISLSGNVTGMLAGNTTISYTLPTGCRTTAIVTVNPLPVAITGSNTVCEGLSINLANETADGSWSSSAPGILTVSASGAATGIATGVANAIYTLPTGCMATKSIIVNPTPATITGNMSVCAGLNTTLSTASTGGTWSSSAPLTATVSNSGIVSGIAAGSVTVKYALPAGCFTTTIVTVNPLPQPITGNTAICEGLNAQLSTVSTGGNWSSSTPSVATIASDGIVNGIAAGISAITYTLPTGCITTKAILVNPLPGPITGNTTVCEGSSTMLGNAATGGSWTSSNTSVALMNTSGLATGISAGNAVITYTLPTGCLRVTSALVNPLPAPVTGNGAICAGLTTSFASATPFGTWSSATSVATIDETGTISAIAAGTSKITYMLSTGCLRTKTVTVNPLPALITGSTNVCEGLTTMLTNVNNGGTWTSNLTTVADVNATTGVVTANAAGSATITYTLPTSCLRTKVVNVSAAAGPISGVASVCRGLNTTLSNATAGGLWISENTTVATVNVASGVVNGLAAGTATISYALPSGCTVATIVTVNAFPAAISGAMSVCIGGNTNLTNTTAGGLWSSNDPTVATVNATTGAVSAASAGSVAIMYTLPTGCSRTAAVIVNGLPDIKDVTGGGSYCAGGAGALVSLNGSAVNTTYKLYKGAALIGSYAGTGATLDFGMFTTEGSYSVTATTATGCSANMNGTATVSINPVVAPSVTVMADNNNICQGTVIHYTATPATAGSSPVYSWSVNGSVMGSAAGFTYTPANGDIIKATITSSETCALPLTASDHITMNVVANQMPLVSITTTANDTICDRESAEFHALPVYGGTAPAYMWLKNGVNMGAGTSATFAYTPANGDVITCKMTSDYACRLADNATSNAISIAVDSVYVPSVTVVADPGLVIAKGQNTTLTAFVTNAGPAPVYEWMVNGVVVPGATGTKFSSSNFANGDSVTCYVYGSGKCGKPSFNTVTLAVSTTTDVAQTPVTNTNIRLIPNPNNGEFTVSGTLATAADQLVTLEVTDVLGQIVYKVTIMARNGTINEKIQLNNNMANGMYLMNMRSGAEHSSFHFVVKQ